MIAGTVEGAGAALAYRETGSGRPAVVVHDVAADAATWAPSLPRIGGRVIAYDRRGYGSSTKPEGYAATTVEEQAEDLAALLRALCAAPALLLGDGFGALMTLDVAKRHPGLVASLVLADTPLYAFVASATPALAEQRSTLQDALHAGGPAEAIAAYLDGRARAEQVARAQAAGPAFFADYAGLSSWPVTRRELRAITIPAVVLTRPHAASHVAAAADALAGLLPAATRVRDGDPVDAAAAR
ncbi:MAG: alpha/beta hydrolase [Actinomycetota bacterium]|nr:alpha/beta hydrolase [Actinomycetota bacterium]